ncbi:hypothetical protein [Leuconostoc sp. S50]|uniref:hypothetical protein n=1 Tax=Leuconostoc sp. S50 TaxID=2767461 RepID=UPI0019064488|nr:hypothetical protein [Leuconostoc sp. S50]MBK0051041.1 hypothetical protein [Leuconostoc sp. S50]
MTKTNPFGFATKSSNGLTRHNWTSFKSYGDVIAIVTKYNFTILEFFLDYL